MKIYMIKNAHSPDVLLCQYFPIAIEYVLFMNDDDLLKIDKTYERAINGLIKLKLKQAK